MDKKFEKIYEIAEREGWQVDSYYVDGQETEVCFSFENYSPAGRDLSFEVSVPNEEDEEGKAPKIKAGLEDFGNAFEKWRDERPQDYADFCTGHGDFYTGWSFIQYVQFGEVIY